MAYLLQQDSLRDPQQQRLLPRVRFENQFCLNCWWGDLAQPWVRQPPFIVHYAGCQLCSGVSPQELNACEGSFRDAYVQSYCTLVDSGWAGSGGGNAAAAEHQAAEHDRRQTSAVRHVVRSARLFRT